MTTTDAPIDLEHGWDPPTTTTRDSTPTAAELSPLAAERSQLLRSRLLTVEQLKALPPPDPLIGTVLYRRSLAVLWGKPGSGKSFVALDWSLHVARGAFWFGRPVTKGTVVYLAAEGVAGMSQRVEAWAADRQLHAFSDEFLLLPGALNLLDRQWSDALIEVARELRPALIVADTLARSIPGGDENTARDMGVAIDAANRVQTASDAAVLFVHHDTKEGSTMRGSGALLGAVDTSIECKSEGQEITLRCEKQKDAAAFNDIRLWRQPAADSCVIWSRDRVAATIASTAGESALLEAAGSSCGSDGLPTGALLKVSALPERTFYRALKALVEKGDLVNVGTEKAKRYTTKDQVEQTTTATTANHCHGSAQELPPPPPPYRGGSEAAVAADNDNRTSPTDPSDGPRPVGGITGRYGPDDA